MKLSSRLRAIAQQVPQGARVVDVGTDHALLPIFLIQQGQAGMAVATDVAVGPYHAALDNVQRNELTNQISVRLGNGLDSVAPGEVDVVVIAGMGGSLETEILRQAPMVMERVKRIILQPMNAADRVRRFLHENGLSLVQEQVIHEDKHFYDILTAEKRETQIDYYKPFSTSEALLQLAYQLGPINLQHPTRDFVLYAANLLEHWRTVLLNLQQSQQLSVNQKASQLEEQINLLSNWFESHQVREGGDAVSQDYL